MRKTTKKLLMFALATLVVGAGFCAMKTIDATNTNVAMAEEATTAVSLDGTFTPSFNSGAYTSDSNYDRTSIYLASSVAFGTSGGVYLNDHKDGFASIDLMDYIYVNGKSARAIWNDRGGDTGAVENYPDSTLVLGTWAPITVEVLPYGTGTAIRVDVDRRYMPTASLEVTLKACEFELNGAAYKVSEDQIFKMTLGEIGNTAAWGNLKIASASEAPETAVAPGFIRASKWDDLGNYYKFMIQGPATDIKMNAAHGNGTWVMDNLCYFHDYMLVNGRSITEIELEDYDASFNFSGSPIASSRNYALCVMPQVYVNATDNYLSFNINKDWMKAQGLELGDIQLTIKAGMPYYGSDGVVYRTTADFSTYTNQISGGSFDASRTNYGISENGIGTYEIGTIGVDMQTPNCGWHLTQLDVAGGLNEGDEANIFINGKSIAEWNATDDSAWTYTGIGWPNDSMDVFHKPIVMNFMADRLQLFIHPELRKIMGDMYVDIEIPEAFTIVNSEMTHKFEVPAVAKTYLYAAPVDVTVITGNPRTNPECVTTINTKYGETVTLTEPTAEGKTFKGWTDVEGNAVEASFVATEATAVYATWDVIPYTVTINKLDGTTESFKFGVEAVEGIDCSLDMVAYSLSTYLPVDDADWDYEWAEELPAEFALQDYTFTVTATEITTVDFFIMGETTTVEIPAGKTAQTYPRMAGAYTFAWTGDATVKVDGNAIENGAVVELWNSYIEIIPTNAEEVCTVELTVVAYVAPATELVIGENAIAVEVVDYYCAGTVVEFTAEKAGTYVLSVAEGEENADVTHITENEATWVENMPYEFTLAEGETIKFVIATTAYMTLAEDEINLVLAEKVEVEIPDDSSSEESSEDVSSEDSSSEDVSSEESSEDVSSEEESSTKPESSKEDSSSKDETSSSEEESGDDALIKGCFGSVSGLGVAALGLCAAVLFKKKED